jgi:hypothetical protein
MCPRERGKFRLFYKVPDKLLAGGKGEGEGIEIL